MMRVNSPENVVFHTPLILRILFVAVFMSCISQSAVAQWVDAPIEYRETVSMVIDESPVWDWMPEEVRHFQEVSVSPDGSMIAFTVRLDFYMNKHIYVMNSDGTGLVDITSTLPASVREENAQNVGRLRWNDDGSRLFFFGKYYEDLYYYDVGAGSTIPAVMGIADPDFRIPYSINAGGTQVTFKHNAGWNAALERDIVGLFTAEVGGNPVNLVDTANLPHETMSVNSFAYLGAARTGNKAFFVWNQDFLAGDATAQWMYNGDTVMQGDLSHTVWPDQGLDNNLVSADGGRVLYENIYRYGEDPMRIGYVDTDTNVFTAIAETTDLNGFGNQHISYDGTKARISGELYNHTVISLDDLSMRDTGTYYFKMSIYDMSDMTADNRYYYILTSKNNDTATHRISVVDMAPDTFDAAPQIHSISFSDSVLYHNDDSRIKVQAHVTDVQGNDTIEWVILAPLVEGREQPDWPMGRGPLSFPATDVSSVVLVDDGTSGDTTAGDGMYSFNQIATRKGYYEGMNTWFDHYDLPAEVGVRIIVKDTDGNYGIADTKLMITDAVPASPDADFSVSVQDETLPLTADFIDMSSGNITTWVWDFGDGYTGTGPTVSHTYTESGLYDVTLTVTGPGGSDTFIFERAVAAGDVAVEENTPLAFALNSPYPNPFNPSTTLDFTLPENLKVHLAVYDIRGACIATLADEFMSCGRHVMTWNGCHDNGKPASSGVYFFRLNAGTMTAQKKALLVK